MSKEAAPSFDEIIKEGRLRKRNEALAAEIFGRGRRPGSVGSGVGGRKKLATTPSLASRVGITKRSVSTSAAASNIDNKWGHDLHHKNNPQASRVSQLPARNASARISRDNRLYAALQADNFPSIANNQANTRTSTNGISIKGAAGPYTVVASNFAPGTTAADIRSAMEQVTTDITSCIVVTANPTVIAEIVFQHRENAEGVIKTFNGQLADGRTLYVYMKHGPPTMVPNIPSGPSKAARPNGSAIARTNTPPTGPRARTGPSSRAPRNRAVELTDVEMDVDPPGDSNGSDKERKGRGSQMDRRLYSDDFVKRGRGFL